MGVVGQKSLSVKVEHHPILNSGYKLLGMRDVYDMGNGEFWEVTPEIGGLNTIKVYRKISTPDDLLNEGA